MPKTPYTRELEVLQKTFYFLFNLITSLKLPMNLLMYQCCTALSNDSIEEKDTQDANEPHGEKYEWAEHAAEVMDLTLDGEVAGHLERNKTR